MWLWLQKLLRIFQEEEKEATQGRSIPSTGRVQAKTKNIYPRERRGEALTRENPVASAGRAARDRQRQFRFPVIPDQPKDKGKSQPSDINPPATGRTAWSVRPEPQVSKPKPAYKPTEVLSPVYGRLEPDGTHTHTKIITTYTPESELPGKEAKPKQGPGKEPRSLAGENSLDAMLLEDDRSQPAASDAVNDRCDDDNRGPDGQTGSYNSPDMANLPILDENERKAMTMDEQPVALVAAETAVAADTLANAVTEAATDVQTERPADAKLAASLADNATSADPSEHAMPWGSETLPEGAARHLREEAVPDTGMVAQQDRHSQEEAGPEMVAQTPAEQEPVVRISAEQAPVEQAPRVDFPTGQASERRAEVSEVDLSVSEQSTPANRYQYPPLSLLNPMPELSVDDDEQTEEQKRLLEETLHNFHVNAQVTGIVKGPSVTRFELQPAPGVKVNKITSLIDDIKLNLAAKDIRIEAPIPGRNAVGIEVPNIKSRPVFISHIIGSEKFRHHPSPLAIALGMDIGGEPIVADIKKMPHGLIAGSTGSGKSVCINSIIVSLLYKASPEQVRLLLIDPKMVELAPYNHLPHLVTPVVTDAKQATAALKWAVEEMERRYALFVDAGARDIERYNQTTTEPLPYIVIIIDELADLMMVSPQDVEDSIIRIAQKARACGIHLLLATQRPSVDVITGNIKANVPTRLAFAVFSQVDSRTILDQSGAERLLGRGDMLFLESGAVPLRLQGNFVSDDEIERVTQVIKRQRKPEYLFSKEDLEQQVQSYEMGDDPLYFEALVYVAEQGQASASALQRRFRIGYNRAARLIEMMEAEGHVAGQSGGKPRAVLITREDAQALAEGSSLV